MIHEHSLHILLIAIQIFACALFIFRKKLNLRSNLVSVLIFSLTLYTSSSGLLFAHHQSQSSEEHPCCQFITLAISVDSNTDILNEKTTLKTEKGDSLASLLGISIKSIRAPPSITS